MSVASRSTSSSGHSQMESASISRDQGRKVSDFAHNVRRAVELAQSYVKEAEYAHKLAPTKRQRMMQSRDRLRNGAKQLKELTQSIQTLSKEIGEKCENVYAGSKAILAESDRHRAALDVALEEVQQASVAESLVGVAEHTRLVDYVDQESLTTLNESAEIERGVISQFLEESYKYIKALDDEMVKLNDQYGTLVEEAERWDEGADRVVDFSGDVKGMLDTLREVEDLSRKIVSADSLLLSAQQRDVDGELSTVMRKVEERVTLLYRKLQDVLGRAGALDNLAQKLNVYFVTVMQSVTDLESFLSELREKSVIVNTMQYHWENHTSAMRDLMQETEKLSSWFKNYITAHDQLPSEIRRRLDFEEKQQKLVDRFRREMGALVTEEMARRDDFAESFGRYLPESLCPGLDEDVVMVEVSPSHVKSSLRAAIEARDEANAAKNEEVRSPCNSNEEVGSKK
uniref:Autophagy protein ATG17-like domain-containing protein n=1 Tax=Palpitomonas bilix TaxID=652834 RepID=A0A7S3DES0_9EUKA|mmetsp:Transcript_34252/g.88496  ORF Transcript_34252/g.88496 Transcript_34252/m.88496 type:complete len:457 (+) Transcript_34252:127-1497(+)